VEGNLRPYFVFTVELEFDSLPHSGGRYLTVPRHANDRRAQNRFRGRRSKVHIPLFSALVSGRENSAVHHTDSENREEVQVAAENTLAYPGITALLVTGPE
jgi:hypothetical protein